jgi:predicted RNA-binding protein Jag
LNLRAIVSVEDIEKGELTSSQKNEIRDEVNDLKKKYITLSTLARVLKSDLEKEIPENVKKEIKDYLKKLVEKEKKSLEISPEDYTEPGSDTPNIDVRLQWHDGEWNILIGNSDYDTDTRGYWGSSSITPDTKSDELAEDLIDQVEEHMATN